MRIITAPYYYEPFAKDTSVFLAGGITNCGNWQQKIIKQLVDNYDYDYDSLVVFNPRRENFPIWDKSAAYEQIEWEFKMLERCDIFSMYFPSGESDQPICMYELGRNILRMQMRFPADWRDRIIISVEDGYKRKQDVLIQTGLATQDTVLINTQTSPWICLSYHLEMIIRAYKKLSNARINNSNEHNPNNRLLSATTINPND